MTFFALGKYPVEKQKVRIVALQTTDGMLIAQHLLKLRRPNTTGTVRCFVPGHGGDVWVVDHEDGTAAPYSVDEMEPLDN